MEALALLVEAIDAFPDDLSHDEVVAAFAESDRLAARLSAALERLDPGADGAVNLRQWLRHRARRSDREAALFVKRTARLRSCPVTRAAWCEGSLTTGQVDAVIGHVSDRTEAVFVEHEPELVPALARLTVRGTETVMRRWAAYADALVDSPPPEPSDRTVHLSVDGDGWADVSGRLDPGGFQVVNAALDAATAPDVEGEPARTRGQRRADALIIMGRFFLDHADTAATSRGSRPDVTVVVTLDELERATGQTVDGDSLDAASIGSLLCDAGVHRVVTDGRSVILDAGRTTRTVSHYLFSAVAVRDGGCRFPGCDRPVSWCEAHHVVPWQHGGSTDQSNLVLLCWRHHHDFAHHPQWQLKLLPDATVEVTRPDGTVLTSHPPPVPVRCDWPRIVNRL
jgi:hypothetical protein